MALSGARLKLQKLMQATIADEAARRTWTYDAVRPMPVPASWSAGQHVVGDCSKGTQYLCRWGGAPDPMGNGWSSLGNSSTIWLHLHHVASPGELEVGDIVTFGYSGNDHAAMVLQAGVDPLLWSFGHQGAPNSYRLSYDRRIKTYCKLPIVPPPPTRVEVLRAMTGFYSWVAWKLAEGPWRDFSPAEPKVRPNVPKLISPLWWARFAQFLAARNSGNKATTG